MVREISQGVRNLAQTPTLIKKKIIEGSLIVQRDSISNI
jgi:hypothetical protein